MSNEERWTRRTFTSRGVKAGTEMIVPNRGFEKTLLMKGEGRVPVVYPTLIPEIDFFLSTSEDGKKGFSGGGWHMITGPAETLKSAVLDRVCINTLNAGGEAYRLERDGHWTRETFLNGVVGRIRDPKAAAENFNLANVNSFEELAVALTEIIVEKKEELFEYAKKNKLEWSEIHYARDIRPVVIVIDSLAGFMAETSLKKEYDGSLGEVKVAEENSALHRLMKTTQGSLRWLGISVIVANQFRANIQAMGYGPTQRPYAWTSMQWELHTALDFRVTKEKATSRKRDYQNRWILNVKGRKLKGQDNYRNTDLIPVHFYPRYGFDTLAGILSVLEYTGFLEGTAAKFTILKENKSGSIIPHELNGFVGVHDKKEFSERLKSDPLYAKELLQGFYASLYKLDPEWIEDRREVVLDNLLFGVEEPAEKPKRKKAAPAKKDDGTPKAPAKSGRKKVETFKLEDIPEHMQKDYSEEFEEESKTVEINVEDNQEEDDILD